MSTPDRLDPALRGGDGVVTAAHAEREARLTADAASMLAGNAPGHDEQLTHHQGAPSVQEQMHSHGQAPPSVPETGGMTIPEPGSASRTRWLAGTGRLPTRTPGRRSG